MSPFNLDIFFLPLFEKLRRSLFNKARKRCLRELNPRRWSNTEIRKLAPFCTGDVLNVSGWKDEDKEGRHYRDYFSGARNYAISNYSGSAKMDDGAEDSLYFDLEGPFPGNLKKRFDTVFCHTVLEHIFEIKQAIANIACIARENILIVVPFSQDEHYRPEIFGDYWRFTPQGISRLVQDQGFIPVYINANDSP